MSEHQIYQQLQHFKELGNLDDLYLGVVSPPFQSCEDDIRKIVGVEPWNSELVEPKKRWPYIFTSSAFEVLRKHGRRRLNLDGKRSTEVKSPRAPTLSTEIIIKLAAEKFIQSVSCSSNAFSMLSHPYPNSILGHSEEDPKGIQLVQNLLSCAEKVGEKQYERVIKFVKECSKMSSDTGIPIQRLVFYFSEALFEKIAKETGRIIPKVVEKEPVDPLAMEKSSSMMLIAFHKEHPLSQITKFVGIQAILDHLEKGKKVHMIDFEIRNGVQWIILMHALVVQMERPVHHLKITAVGTKLKFTLEDTGRQLASFAQSLSLKFTFKVVMVEDILDLKESLFDLAADEVVAVYAAYTLMSVVGKVDRLDHLMRVIRNIRPYFMVVTEMEVNCNSPNFIGRFVESLFFFGAFFDTLADCFKKDETNRRDAESMWFRSSIRNVLAAEGEERKIRHVNINVWRAFFARFGLVEIELSMSSLDQANLVLRSFPSRSSCILHLDGKCLTIVWKGTPLSSLSVWNFQ